MGKKVRLSVDEKEESSKKDDSKVEERKRHASAGQQQVKQLYDGLSHLYNDCDSRLRSAPKDHKSKKNNLKNEGVIKVGMRRLLMLRRMLMMRRKLEVRSD